MSNGNRSLTVAREQAACTIGTSIACLPATNQPSGGLPLRCSPPRGRAAARDHKPPPGTPLQAAGPTTSNS